VSDHPPIRKAVFPVAGLGTRFLPATKAIPKELLPIVDKPLIQYAVEEACEAGIETIILVTRGDKQAISSHFSPAPDLEAFLEERNSEQPLERVRAILPGEIDVLEVIQEQPLGLGHAVLCARELVGDEPFAVILPDDMIRSSGPGALRQMVEIYQRSGHSVIGVEEIPAELTRRYGVAAVQANPQGLLEIKSIVEKPAPEEAPSNLGVVGRYVLSGSIFEMLENLGAGVGGEIQLTDAIARLMSVQSILAHPFEGRRFDCGSRLGFVLATLEYALANAELAPALEQFLNARRVPDRS
jgi:UTP--glucose-1-phosphate uridylyltransferase